MPLLCCSARQRYPRRQQLPLPDNHGCAEEAQPAAHSSCQCGLASWTLGLVLHVKDLSCCLHPTPSDLFLPHLHLCLKLPPQVTFLMLGLRKQATNKSQTLEPLLNSIFSASLVHTRQRLSLYQQPMLYCRSVSHFSSGSAPGLLPCRRPEYVVFLADLEWSLPCCE